MLGLRTGATMYLQTVFIAILAYFILGEAIYSYHLVAAIILVGVSTFSRSGRSRCRCLSISPISMMP